MKDFLLSKVLYAPDSGADGTNGADLASGKDNKLMDKFTAMQARIDALEAKKEEVLETPAEDGKKSEVIKDIKISDLQSEIESLKASKQAEQEAIMDTVMMKIQLEQKVALVQESKKDFLKDALAGKSMKEQLDYIDKYAGELLMPTTQYNGGTGTTGSGGGTSEIDKIMKDKYIIESGLSRKEVEEFMNQDDVRAFERKLMNDYRNIRSTQGVYNFFNKGANK